MSSLSDFSELCKALQRNKPGPSLVSQTTFNMFSSHSKYSYLLGRWRRGQSSCLLSATSPLAALSRTHCFFKGLYIDYIEVGVVIRFSGLQCEVSVCRLIHSRSLKELSFSFSTSCFPVLISYSCTDHHHLLINSRSWIPVNLHCNFKCSSGTVADIWCVNSISFKRSSKSITRNTVSPNNSLITNSSDIHSQLRYVFSKPQWFVFFSVKWKWFVFFCFSWLNPLLQLGQKHKLEKGDMYSVLPEDRSETLGEELQRYFSKRLMWQNQKWCWLRNMSVCFKLMFYFFIVWIAILSTCHCL